MAFSYMCFSVINLATLSKVQLLHYTEPKRRRRQGGQFVLVVLHTPDHHPCLLYFGATPPSVMALWGEGLLTKLPRSCFLFCLNS